MQPVNVPAPPPPIETGFWAGVKSFARGTWEFATQAADIGLKAYGIHTGKQVAIETTRINKDLQLGLSDGRTREVIALGGGIERVSVANANALAQVALRPVVPTTQIAISGNSGPVNLGGNQDNRRTCTGGNSQAGTGTATVPAATGQGGPANC